MAKEYTEAAKVLDAGIEMFPPSPVILWSRLRLAYLMGDRKTIDRKSVLLASLPDIPLMVGLHGFVGALEGRKEVAAEALRKLELLREKEYVDALSPLDICFTFGDRNCAALWFKRAYEERSTVFVYLPLYFKDHLSMVPEAPALLSAIH
jgi:hypothetical protein